MKTRRHPTDKENFMEGNRQRWAAIFTGIGLCVMGATAYGFLKDPTPFLTYFTGIGVTFILGASASAVMNSYKVGSTAATTDETRAESVKVEKGVTYTEKIERPKDYDSEEVY